MGRYEISVAARKDPSFNRVFSEVSRQMESTTLATIGLQSAMNGLRIGSMVGIGAMAAMIVPAVLATSVVADFDSTLRKIGAVGGKEFANSLDIIADKINAMGIEYGLATTELAEGFLEFAKAGFSMQEIMSGLYESTVKMAVLNKTEFSVAAGIATAAWTLFGDTVESSAQMMDMMQAAVSASLMNVEDLTSALQNAGSMFAVTEVPFAEYVTTIAALSQAAYKSTETLATLVARMITYEDEFEGFLGDTGIINEGTINFKKLAEVLSTIDRSDATRILGEITQSSLGGVRAFKPLAALIETAPEWLSIYEEVLNSQGAVDEGIDLMTFSIENLRGAIENALLAPLQDKEFLDEISSMLKGIKDLMVTSNLGEDLREIVRFSIEFIRMSAPKMILMVKELLGLVKEFYPSLSIIAESFLSILKWVSKIPAPLLMVASALLMVSKIVPIKQFLMWVESARTYVTLQKEALSNQMTMNTLLNTTIAKEQLKNAMAQARFGTTQAAITGYRAEGIDAVIRQQTDVNYPYTAMQPTIATGQQLPFSKTTLTPPTMVVPSGAINELDTLTKSNVGFTNSMNQSTTAMQNNINTTGIMAEKHVALNGAINTSGAGMNSVGMQAQGLSTQMGTSTRSLSIFQLAAQNTNAGLDVMGMKLKTTSTGALTLGSKLRVVNATIIQTGIVSQIAASLGIMALMSGFMMIITNSDSTVRAISAISIALGLATIAAMAFQSMIPGGGWAVLALGLAAMAATTLAMKAQMDQANRDMEASMEEYGSAQGGHVLSTGMRYIHKDEFIVPKEHIAKVNDQDQLFAKASGRSGGTTNNKNTSTVTNDNRTINIYQVRQYELERALIASGY